MATWEALLTIAGLALISLLTRGFFILPSRDVPIPDWLRQGLRYAPVAALTAVVVPEIVLTQGHLLGTWQAGQAAADLKSYWVYAGGETAAPAKPRRHADYTRLMSASQACRPNRSSGSSCRPDA